MKKKILISMYSLHIGGAERSLIGLLENFDYRKYDVDLFLYRQEGEFLRFIPKEVNLVPTINQYTTFERPVKEIIKEGYFFLGSVRIAAKFKTKLKNRGQKKDQGTYKQMQYTWYYSMPGLPSMKKEYDLAISFLGPHNFIIDKVKAKKKIGWNHTDYFTIVNPDKKLDEKMWSKLDYIVNVSKACEDSFLMVFPKLKHKTIVLENILSPTFVREQSKAEITNEIIQDESINICSVGRLSYAKGFDLAILACKKLVESGYDVKWYVVGYGREEDYLKQLIKEYNLTNKFILLGKKVNPYPFIKNCDIYCQPSRYEGKAVTVREAQILGKPVLITDYPTANSQLEAGIDGLIYELSIEGIVNGIKKLIMDTKLRNNLSNNCLKKDFGNISEINKLYSLFNQIEIEEKKKVII